MITPPKQKRKIPYLRLPKKKYHIKGTVLENPDPENEPAKGRIWIECVEIFPETACTLRPFYECWFQWGDQGASGAYTAALSICLFLFKEDRLAENVFTCFYDDFIKDLPDGDFEQTIDLTAFLKKNRPRLQPGVYSRFCFSALLNSREILLHKNPVTGEITANMVENYTMTPGMIANDGFRKLNERKQKLLTKLFMKNNTNMIKGNTFEEVMAKADEIMGALYWRSLEKVLKKQFSENFKD